MVILQIHFHYTGGYGEQMFQECEGLAHAITKESGFLWKIWTEDQAKSLAGGVYAFESREQAQAYATIHMERLSKFGVASDFVCEIFDINDQLSAITNFKK